MPERFQELGRRAKVAELRSYLHMSTEDLASRRTQDLKGEWSIMNKNNKTLDFSQYFFYNDDQALLN